MENTFVYKTRQPSLGTRQSSLTPSGSLFGGPGHASASARGAVPRSSVRRVQILSWGGEKLGVIKNAAGGGKNARQTPGNATNGEDQGREGGSPGCTVHGPEA